MKQSTLATLAVAAALGISACGTDPSTVDASIGEHTHTQLRMDDLDGFAQQIEDLVSARDRESLGTAWLTQRELDGCTLEREEPRSPTEIRDAYRGEFDRAIQMKLTRQRSGQVLFTNRRDRDTPTYGRSKLVGADCKATRWGRIAVIVRPDARPSKPIEHRFNALLVDDVWRLYRYLPNEPDCATEAGRKHMGCQKLLEAQRADGDDPSQRDARR